MSIWRPKWTRRKSGHDMATASIKVHVHRPAVDWLAEKTGWSVTRAARWLLTNAGFHECLNESRACCGTVLVVSDGKPWIHDRDDYPYIPEWSSGEYHYTDTILSSTWPND